MYDERRVGIGNQNFIRRHTVCTYVRAKDVYRGLIERRPLFLATKQNAAYDEFQTTRKESVVEFRGRVNFVPYQIL